MPGINSLLYSSLCTGDQQRIVVTSGQRSFTASQFVAEIDFFAELLVEHNLKSIALFSDNSAEWIALDLACQKLAITLLPLPLFFSDTQIEHALQVSGIEHVIVAANGVSRAFMQKFEVAAAFGSNFCLWSSHGEPTSVANTLPPGTQKITFTSGSTGNPKGVCLSVEQQITVAQSLVDAIEAMPVRHLCLLPLSTLLENVGGAYAGLLGGGEVLAPQLIDIGMSGSSGVDHQKLLAAISQLQPNSMIILPQLLTLLVAAVEKGWQPPSSLQYIAVGGGMVSPALIKRAISLGLPVHQGYGLSECASVVALNQDSLAKPESVGRPLKHISVRIEDDEIMVSGNTFLGYINDPESWGLTSLYTGDLGSIDEDGCLTVKGRRKNIQISSFGRNINPEWVESELQASSLIGQSAIYTEAKPYSTALVYPINNEVSEASLQKQIDKINETLPDYAQIKGWWRMEEKFSVANGMLTENGRLKREKIYRFYREKIEKLYSLSEEIK